MCVMQIKILKWIFWYMKLIYWFFRSESLYARQIQTEWSVFVAAIKSPGTQELKALSYWPFVRRIDRWSSSRTPLHTTHHKRPAVQKSVSIPWHHHGFVERTIGYAIESTTTDSALDLFDMCLLRPLLPLFSFAFKESWCIRTFLYW